mmetsp:Transcript_65840/g.147009  ORF Transcript_65840/g.147009 Transcript_65840/m.147009 type:complete len:241 (+) Transcript_65840:156-878(+)
MESTQSRHLARSPSRAAGHGMGMRGSRRARDLARGQANAHAAGRRDPALPCSLPPLPPLPPLFFTPPSERHLQHLKSSGTRCVYRLPADRSKVGAESTASHRPAPMKTGPRTRETVDRSLISTCSEGPAVSLNGSPTVSPVTAALCASLPLPPYLPDSMYFFALSHAPPALFRKSDSRMPVVVAVISSPATTCGPSNGLPCREPMQRKMKPMAIGKPSASSPGFRISERAAAVTIATHLL